jgi:hypothetical protein
MQATINVNKWISKKIPQTTNNTANDMRYPLGGVGKSTQKAPPNLPLLSMPKKFTKINHRPTCISFQYFHQSDSLSTSMKVLGNFENTLEQHHSYRSSMRERERGREKFLIPSVWVVQLMPPQSPAVSLSPSRKVYSPFL